MTTPSLNPGSARAVPAPVHPSAPAIATRRGAAGGSALGRFLTLSFVLHAVVIASGIAGGSHYARRSGAEAREATIVFAIAPETTETLVTPESEPERSLEKPTPDEPTVVETAPERAPDPVPESELLASLSASSAPAKSIGEILGDPRSLLVPAAPELKGLAVGLAVAPHVADCCGEPQPKPAVEAAPEAYVYPIVLHMERARFPAKSQRLGEQGSVLLEMSVGADGRVADVTVVESSGHPRLDDCAVDAAWGWIFRPATKNGAPVAALARHRYTFRLLSARG